MLIVSPQRASLYVFALHRGRILASTVKQIVVLGVLTCLLPKLSPQA